LTIEPLDLTEYKKIYSYLEKKQVVAVVVDDDDLVSSLSGLV